MQSLCCDDFTLKSIAFPSTKFGKVWECQLWSNCLTSMHDWIKFLRDALSMNGTHAHWADLIFVWCVFYCFIYLCFVNFQANLDTDFDAGGKVSIGLTATTIVSQWTWAATLLQSSGVAAKVSTWMNELQSAWTNWPRCILAANLWARICSLWCMGRQHQRT